MNRPEVTYEDFCNLPLTYTLGVSADKYALRQYVNHKHGFGKQTTTPFEPTTMEWGEQQTLFYLTDDERNFDTPDQLYVAYMEKACGLA